MPLVKIATVITGVSGAPYYSNHFFLVTLGTEQAAADAVAAFWTGCASRMTSLARIEVLPNAQIIDTATGQPTQVTGTTGSIIQGTVAGDRKSPALQMLVQWRTGIFEAGRELRGRTFIPALGANAGEDVPTQAAIDDILEAANALNDVTAAELSIYSRVHGVSHVVQNVGVWGQFAVLRSRRD